MKPKGGNFLLTRVLFSMSRPTHLLLIAFVYLFGTVIALADGASLEVSTFWIGLFVLIPLSASVHYANEYADFETDSLTNRTLFSGGSGALPKSGLPRIIALRAAWGAVSVGSLIALLAIVRGSLSALSLGILLIGTLFGWMYSLKPLALGWRGLGELDNAVLGGVLLPLYGYVVQAGRFEAWVIVALLPFGGAVFINLLATTWPDRAADLQVGKRTLATRMPTGYLRVLYWSFALAIVISVILLLHRVLPVEVVFGSLLISPVLLWGGLRYTRQHSPFPTATAMVLLLAAQFVGWWSTIDFCCLFNPI
jgi:1,4-dihydroxy-2-naphthoate octaprenyltransferase